VNEGETLDLGRLEGVARNFQITGELIEIKPYGIGHINKTYASCYVSGTHPKWYIHQKLNHHVFKEPENVMDNCTRITTHAGKLVQARGGDLLRETLNLVPTLDEKMYFQSDDGEYWRTFLMIQDAKSYEIPENPRQVYEAAKAYGDYQRLLTTLPGKRLHETIPDFHNTTKRYRTLSKIISADPQNRVQYAKREIEFIHSHTRIINLFADLIKKGKMPERIAHNDTKLNNVLLDIHSDKAICVIDLDTTMPGYALHDFGDMVRTGAATAKEDDDHFSNIGIDLQLFEQLTMGYLEATSEFLLPIELENLCYAGIVITLEQGIRFLSDYLVGDLYYKTLHSEHNLIRTKNQLKMVSEMESRFDEIKSIIMNKHSIIEN
jgi:hypothetical protein